MFGKKKPVGLKGPWNNTIQKLLEQSVPITAANILSIENLEDNKGKLIAEVQKLVRETADLIWENCEQRFENSIEEKLMNDTIKSPFGSYSYTKTTSIPREEIEKIVKDVISKGGEIGTKPDGFKGKVKAESKK